MSSLSDGELLGKNSLLGLLAVCVGAGAVYLVEKNKRRKEADKAREDGYKDGRKDGENTVMKRLRDKMLANNKLKLGVFALGCYIANIDGEFTQEEQAAIAQAIGSPDTSWTDVGLQEEFHRIMEEIYDHKMNFNDIKEKYLNDINRGTFEDLDEVVMSVIHADGKVAIEEQNFLDNEWEIFKCQHI
ncbi:TerB family tellurite resistance protein [Phascolarctobacterium succinatutens]|uniref:tellurite resistance TerB family protein n=1 Tax=Phascolarctobacterium succinatutens TaxID=626940 RepID=UPI0026ECEE82|nr:TerB family tellurite resistance protein [Phascolarctobacterium succinatutens]